MPKIKAAVAHEFGKPLKVEDVILRSPVNNEVEVTLGAVAICHSDISYMEGAWGGFLPAVYGHEASGNISNCLLYTSPSPRDRSSSRMPSSA